MKKLLSMSMLIACVLAFTSCSKGGATSVTDQDITLNFSFGEMQGTYTGDLVDGVPNGNGKFSTKNAEGKNWYYEGSFKDGHFNGEGKNVWESGQIQEGNFVMDIWDPNPFQFFQFIESIPSTNFTITENAKKTLQSVPEIFPAASTENLKEYTDDILTYSTVLPNIEQYGDKLMVFSNLMVTKIDSFAISENPEGNQKLRCTYLTLVDGDLNLHELYYEGDISNLKIGDTLSTVYALPIGVGTVEITNANPAKTLILAGSYVEKPVVAEEPEEQAEEETDQEAL